MADDPNNPNPDEMEGELSTPGGASEEGDAVAGGSSEDGVSDGAGLDDAACASDSESPSGDVTPDDPGDTVADSSEDAAGGEMPPSSAGDVGEDSSSVEDAGLGGEVSSTDVEPSSDDGTFDQADIDALTSSVQGAGSVDAPGDGDSESAADLSGEFSQADIDALTSAAGDDVSGGIVTSDVDSMDGAASDGSFSQADIDAAFGESSGLAGDVAADAPSDLTGQAGIDALLSGGVDGVLQESEEPQLDSAGRPFDAAAAEMAAAIAEEAASAASAPSPPETSNLSSPDLPDFTGKSASSSAKDISILRDVDMHVHIELGRTRMFLDDVIKLGEGSVVELDALAGDPVDVFVNDRLVARGEVLVLGDNFCVRVSEIVSGPQLVDAG